MKEAVIDLDVARGEQIEADLVAFTARRDAQRRAEEGERREEALWKESVRRYHEKEREGLLWERLRYHEALVRAHSATFELLLARHRAEIARCEALLGINDSEVIEEGAA